MRPAKIAAMPVSIRPAAPVACVEPPEDVAVARPAPLEGAGPPVAVGTLELSLLPPVERALAEPDAWLPEAVLEGDTEATLTPCSLQMSASADIALEEALPQNWSTLLLKSLLVHTVLMSDGVS